MPSVIRCAERRAERAAGAVEAPEGRRCLAGKPEQGRNLFGLVGERCQHGPEIGAAVRAQRDRRGRRQILRRRIGDGAENNEWKTRARRRCGDAGALHVDRKRVRRAMKRHFFGSARDHPVMSQHTAHRDSDPFRLRRRSEPRVPVEIDGVNDAIAAAHRRR